MMLKNSHIVYHRSSKLKKKNFYNITVFTFYQIHSALLTEETLKNCTVNMRENDKVLQNYKLKKKKMQIL